MLRNVESRFATQPNVNIPRTRMRIPHRYTTTWNVGELIPTFCTEVIPGSSHRVKSHKVVRTQPLVSAPMDDLYLDTYYFFVPFRLVWSHWKEFMGENTTSPWVPNVTYQIPMLRTWTGTSAPSNPLGVRKGSLLDYFGCSLNLVQNPKTEYIEFSALYTRAYALIVREFFQDQNLETPINVPLDDLNRTIIGITTSSASSVQDPQNIHAGANPYIVNKFHDYFTSALPSPVKSATDLLAFPDMPIIVTDKIKSNEELLELYPSGIPSSMQIITGGTGTSFTTDTASAYAFNSNKLGIPSNLSAVSGTTLHDLRVAFAIDRLLQRDAIGGTRYREMLRAHFAVTSPDASMQVPQYLGGSRLPLQISQILQTSESNTTPQGNVAGYSLTSDSHYDFDASFTEHGLILGLQCVRYKNSYQQGIHRRFTRKNRLEFYFPEFAKLDSQPIYKKEIYADGSSNDNSVFGYQEYASDYRYHPDVITGEMRSGITNSLDSWHFGDYYNQAPTLSRAWMQVDKSNVDRALAVTSSTSNQLWCNILFEDIATLPMPLYSIPDLMGNF